MGGKPVPYTVRAKVGVEPPVAPAPAPHQAPSLLPAPAPIPYLAQYPAPTPVGNF
eukprot:CAMPEP_0173257596 /NCGR_PEP_ID=MMETSP1142-20121109/23866_1 /TAXON_ID=483371 /ORGANISM="non described non described, Strain CCMP2298" /LENGTH=54 /DNA_ID=CAMNT_0014191759 /DNA_START=165 /DNA_END=329 /DNA_ORIENTATION=+